jgi:hypothetical protein
MTRILRVFVATPRTAALRLVTRQYLPDAILNVRGALQDASHPWVIASGPARQWPPGSPPQHTATGARPCIVRHRSVTASHSALPLQ